MTCKVNCDNCTVRRPSSLGREAVCPGSYALSREVKPEKESKDAISGTLLHKIVKAQEFEGLDLKQEEILETINRTVNTYRQLYGEPILEINETKGEFIHNDEPIVAGTPDRVWLYDNFFIDFDWKFGYIPVSPASANVQIQSYMIQTAQKYSIPRGLGVIVQPFARNNDICVEIDDFSIVLDSILSIISRSKNGAGIYIPDVFECRYCPGKLKCPEIKRMTFDIVASYLQLEFEDQELICLLDESTILAPMIEQIKEKGKDRAKELKQIGQDLGPYSLDFRKGTRQVDDPISMFDHIQNTIGFNDHEELNSILKVSYTAAETLYVEKNRENQTKKVLKQEFERHVEKWISRAPGSYVLKRNRGDSVK